MEKPRLITHRDGLAWLCKPAGWNTHPTAEGGMDVVTWLDTQGKLLKGMRPAHRLDKPTSGVLVVGRRNARSRVPLKQATARKPTRPSYTDASSPSDRSSSP